MTLTRRSFLGLSVGGAVTAATAGTGAWAAPLHDQRTDRPTGSTADRVLVVVQLSGGNDGLNTLVPVTGRYHDLRPTLGLADDDLVALRGESGYGLHPSLAPLGALWTAGDLALVDGIGYPDNSRSHFAALDAWWSATPGTPSATGWLGRWLDANAAGTPDPLRAIGIGGGSPALRASRSRATTIVDPARFALDAPAGIDDERLAAALLRTATPVGRPALRAAAQASVEASITAVDRLGRAGIGAPADGAAADGGEAGAGRVTRGLAVAADLVAHELGTRVIVVDAGGFDTHAGQGETHAALLADVGRGIAAFQRAVTASGHADRTLLVTTSEFGRRARENGSGTDHGNGGVSLVVGAGVAGGVVGTPDLTRLDPAGDVAASIDVRSLYAAALDWLGGPTEEVLGRRYDRHGLLG